MTQDKKDNQNGEQTLPQMKPVIDPRAQARKMELQRVEDLLAGKASPPNEFAAYIIKQANQAAQSCERAAGELMQARARVKSLEGEVARWQGVAEQYVQDLQKWDRPLASSPKKEEAAPEGEKDEATP